MRGLPFSGKTTWAEKFKDRRGEGVLFCIKREVESLSDMKVRQDRLDVVKSMLIDTIRDNNIIIIDDVNILPASISRIMDVIHDYGSRYKDPVLVRIQSLHTPFDLCLERAKRSNANEQEIKRLQHYYNQCLRKKIIYSNEENS